MSADDKSAPFPAGVCTTFTNNHATVRSLQITLPAYVFTVVMDVTVSVDK